MHAFPFAPSSRRLTSQFLAALVVAWSITTARADRPSAIRPVPMQKKTVPKTVKEKPVIPSDAAVESLTEKALKSMVVISHFGRDGVTDGVGAGFVIDPSGLIATSFHVVGESRPITVQLPDGKRHEVVAIHAWDRKLDLAILRIAATNLPALSLGDSDALRQGTTVIALGNPQGLEHSVVKGVVSARRDFDGVEMIQLAIPIEPGNSGGPLLDMQGNVHGILTLKSAVTANLGFAMPVNALKTLIDRPSPVPMNRWLTIGTINSRDWQPLFGSRWTQRSGRVQVEGFGSGFGGRSLCLSKRTAPQPPYELAVTVKLDDEAGAAGLVFGSDGDQRHFGFYPSAGALRLTRFDGPDVFSWQVIAEEKCPAYRPKDWNTLKVRVETNKLSCYVNDELVVEASDPELPGTQVGLAKFRNTAAEFKIFQVGKTVGVRAIPTELAASINHQLDDPSALEKKDPQLVKALQTHPDASRALLIERARKLEKQAGQLRRLAASVHSQTVVAELAKVLAQSEEKIDLVHAALLVAKLDNDEIDVASYRRQFDQLAAELRGRITKDATDTQKVATLNKFLFTENGFHGSRSDFYNRANSYLNEVMDDREGLPITLAILFVDLANRIGLTNVHGTSMPGHMLVKFTPADGEEQLLDVFEGGKPITRDEANELVMDYTGAPLREEQLRTATKREIVTRIVRNLMGISQRSELPDDTLRYLDLIVALNPDSSMERLNRGMLRLRSGDTPGARQDLKWLLDNNPPGIDLDRVAEVLRAL